ncbi:MAG: tetratricopeptide repeat protein [Alphaproteobacteria bacterium]|nr:tetratricopeptide repeat protein [Alphaproteobacteria bacterium]
MLRLLLYITVLMLTAVLLARLIEVPGYVDMVWFGWYIETTPLFLTLSLLGLFALVIGAFWALDRLVSLPSRYRNKRRVEYHERGLSALTEAIAALSVSDIANAKKLTKRSEKLLGKTPITHLLTAQLARLEGDEETATENLKRLLDFKETHFLAARGLLEQARKSGDVETAVTYAQEAGSIRPDSSFAALSLLDVYTHQKRWQQAIEVINRAQRHRALTAVEASRYKALIEYQHAVYLYDRDDFSTAQRYAAAAHKTLPDMVPAAVLLAEIFSTLGKKRNASAVLTRTWKVSPHPEVAAQYKKLLTDLLPEKRVTAMEKFVSVSPEDMESHLAVAEVAFDAGQYGKAREETRKALNILESPRACELMAKLEEAADNKEKATKWHTRASKTLIEAAWACESCKKHQPQWTLHCPDCDAFDSIHWRIDRHRKAADTQASTAVDALPLLKTH